MTKILITGATGFIGQACINFLKNSGIEIHGLYHNKPCKITSSDLIWHHCNILNLSQTTSIIKKIRPDYLINLAWFVEHTLFWTSEKNIPYIAATIHLYKAFSAYNGKKALFLGTCAEYDPNYLNCEEDTTPLAPKSLYGIAKKQTYELLTHLKKDKQDYSPFCWVRLFHVFGQYENADRLIPYIFNCYIQKKPPILNNPNAIRDHLFVDNLAQILTSLLQNNIDGAINVGQNTSLSIKALASKIHMRYFNTLPPPVYDPVTENKHDLFIPNLDKLNNLNLILNYSFEQGLDNVYQWWANNSGIKE